MNEPLECLDGPEGCIGKVELRSVDTIKWWPRCEAHWDERLDEQARINEYLSDIPPSWFDPLAAGERWDEDE